MVQGEIMKSGLCYTEKVIIKSPEERIEDLEKEMEKLKRHWHLGGHGCMTGYIKTVPIW